MNIGMLARRRRSTHRPARVPAAIPPQIPSPPSHTANGPHQCGGISEYEVAMKYNRPPIRPAGKPHSATSLTSAGSPPAAAQRRREINTAASTANTYMTPYTWKKNGPMWKPFDDGLGID